MTNFKFTLRDRPSKDGTKSIIIVFTKDRKNTSLSLRKSCREDQWSEDTERVKRGHPEYKRLNTFIEKWRKIIQNIIDELDDIGYYYDLQDVINKVKNYKNKSRAKNLTEFINEHIENLRKADKIGTAKVNGDTLRSFQSFFKQKDLLFKDLTYSKLMDYEASQLAKGNSPTTIAIRMRTIRNVFNQAIKSGRISAGMYPFKDYKISKLKTNNKKEFLTKEEIAKVEAYQPTDKYEAFAKDIFLFSYYSRGINFIDILKLEKKSVNNGSVQYIRTKTSVPVSFNLYEKNRPIMQKYYSDDESKFVFKMVHTNNPTTTYLKNKSHKYLKVYVNPYLKVIMGNLDIKKHITFYCARHSFATVMKFNNISIDIIREALGQKDIKSTISYLNSFPDKKLDKIIEEII